jgi:hypothetical protein
MMALRSGIATFAVIAACGSVEPGVPGSGEPPKTFRVWVFADAHVGSDREAGRESLAEAIRQSESAAGFDWDIALDLGDVSGAQGTPKDPEGAEIVRQFAALKKHRREQIYDLSGNHDRSGLDEPQAWWWRKWVDPTAIIDTDPLHALHRRATRSARRAFVQSVRSASAG